MIKSITARSPVIHLTVKFQKKIVRQVKNKQISTLRKSLKQIKVGNQMAPRKK